MKNKKNKSHGLRLNKKSIRLFNIIIAFNEAIKNDAITEKALLKKIEHAEKEVLKAREIADSQVKQKEIVKNPIRYTFNNHSYSRKKRLLFDIQIALNDVVDNKDITDKNLLSEFKDINNELSKIISSPEKRTKKKIDPNKIIGWIGIDGKNRCLDCDDSDGDDTITVADLRKSKQQIYCDICGYPLEEND